VDSGRNKGKGGRGTEKIESSRRRYRPGQRQTGRPTDPGPMTSRRAATGSQSSTGGWHAATAAACFIVSSIFGRRHWPRTVVMATTSLRHSSSSSISSSCCCDATRRSDKATASDVPSRHRADLYLLPLRNAADQTSVCSFDFSISCLFIGY